MEKNYLRRTPDDILRAVERFCAYHDWIHDAIDAGKIKASVDRGAFVRPQDVLPEDVLEYLGPKRRSNSYAYGPENGDYQLREKIANIENLKHRTSYTAEHVAMMPGAWAGLECALQECLGLHFGKHNDKPVLVVGPTLYQMFHYPISMLGFDIRSFDFVLPDSPHVPTMGDVDDMFAEKPGVIVITNPTNPDGLYIPQGVLEKIVQMAYEENAFVIIDEIQNCFSAPGKIELRYGRWIQSPNVIRLDCISKRYALAEYRTGWAIAEPKLIGNRMEGIVGIMSGFMGNAPRAANSALMELLEGESITVRTGLQQFPEAYAQLAEKEKYVREELSRIVGEKNILPRDACINLTFKTGFQGTDMELAKKLIGEGVLIMPASGYGYRPEDAVLRFTFAERDEKLKIALHALKKVLRQ